MLICNSCMKRVLQTLIREYSLVSTPPRATFSTISQREDYKRNYTPQEYHRPETAVKLQFQPKKDIESTAHRRQKWLESRGVTPLHKKAEKNVDDTVMRNQLKHLKDPLKLAEHIRATLREDNFVNALAIVRAASKDTQCVVSWNHLIDWQLSKNKMNDAIKTYNEMKKRAQTPDNYTYTILFRGCAEHPLPIQALAKVMTIYNSMLNDKSAIQPNSIHLNAVLKMCARAHDMDALLSITARLPEKGVGSPTKMTYTIILNAIRMHALNDLRGDLTEVQRRKIRQKANLDARRFWKHVTERWRQGDILIDEELTCTMGRVLLLGMDQDIDDVLSLVEQTMNIPRQAPLLMSRKKLQEMDAIRQAQMRVNKPANSIHESNPSWEALSVSANDSSQASASTKKSTGLYANPGQNTLSLLMEALLDLRLKEAATKYWNILTGEYGIEPDAHNYHAYLRVLRLARSSTETVKLLLQMSKEDLAIKTFRIAMSTCRRDKNNQHAFSNAGKTLDLMQVVFKVPDIQVLSDYLDTAVSAAAYSEKVSSNGEHAPSKYSQGRQILRALERLNPSYVNLRSLVAYGDPTKPAPTNLENADLVDSVLNLTKRLVSAHDLLLDKRMVDRPERTELINQRSKLAAFITRFKERRSKINSPYLPEEVIKDRGIHRMRASDLHHRKAVARIAGPKAVRTLRNEWGAAEDQKAMRLLHDDDNRVKFMDNLADQERQPADAALA